MRVLGLFRSGELVPESGQYAALHSTPHTLIEHVTHVEGTRFDKCSLCPLGVWYRLETSRVRATEQVLHYAQA